MLGHGRGVAGVSSVVSTTATSLFELPVVNEHISQLASLNGKGHAFRNVGFQEQALTRFRAEGRFEPL